MNSVLNLKKQPEPFAPVPVPQSNPRFSRRTRLFALGVAVFVFVILPLWNYAESQMTWRAVFLANNQVYFGKLYAPWFSSTATLTHIYYLQMGQALQPQDANSANAAQPQIKLVKLGNELHGPQDEMVIPKQQILFWENLKSDSPVVKTIQSAAK